METTTSLIHRSTLINAPASKVWHVLTDKELVRTWADAFFPGTWAESDWQLGSAVTWMSAENKPVVKGKITILEPNKRMKIDYFDSVEADLSGPTGEYYETSILEEKGSQTQLSFEAGPLSEEDIQTMAPGWDKALEIMKRLAEA